MLARSFAEPGPSVIVADVGRGIGSRVDTHDGFGRTGPGPRGRPSRRIAGSRDRRSHQAFRAQHSRRLGRPQGAARLRVRLSRPERCGKDDSHPPASRTAPRRRRIDVASRTVRFPRNAPSALARVGAIVDEPRFHGHLTGRQNLSVIASAREPEARSRIAPALERVGLTEKADDEVSRYSMGMRQRLGVAACLLGDPELLVLDEPMNGLDPAGMREMREMILGFVREGRTVVLSSHLLDEIQRTCDAVAIVDRGRVVRQGTIDELLQATTVGLQIECNQVERAHQIVADMQEVRASRSWPECRPDAQGLGMTLTPRRRVTTWPR